ncbi:hypothetical protein HWV62_20992 [Athelia sp. TMB]|nr:hypothetical protein HWV62_20992 [Athelia sp. TMB]
MFISRVSAAALRSAWGTFADVAARSAKYPGPSYWFSFGGSYSTTGFVNTSTWPAVGNPLGNPAYPGITIGDRGPNWIDVNTVVYNKTEILTHNYAYNGATIDASLVTPYLPTVMTVADQVAEFLAGPGQKSATRSWTSEDALFSIWVGINDIAHSYTNNDSRSAFTDVLLDAESNSDTNHAWSSPLFWITQPSTALPSTPLLSAKLEISGGKQFSLSSRIAPNLTVWHPEITTISRASSNASLKYILG